LDLAKLLPDLFSSLAGFFVLLRIGGSFLDSTLNGFGIPERLEQMTHHDIFEVIRPDAPAQTIRDVEGMLMIAVAVRFSPSQSPSADATEHHATEQIAILILPVLIRLVGFGRLANGFDRPRIEQRRNSHNDFFMDVEAIRIKANSPVRPASFP